MMMSDSDIPSSGQQRQQEEEGILNIMQRHDAMRALELLERVEKV